MERLPDVHVTEIHTRLAAQRPWRDVLSPAGMIPALLLPYNLPGFSQHKGVMQALDGHPERVPAELGGNI